ncbi:hypothetical protein A6A19_01785 [Actinobacillus delphinicola]|nr:hypothetical protein [Actinobacillus delphinicola]
MKAIQHTAEYTRGAISVGGVGKATTGDNPKDPNTDKYHKWLGTAYGPEEEYTRQITHVAAGSNPYDITIGVNAITIPDSTHLILGKLYRLGIVARQLVHQRFKWKVLQLVMRLKQMVKYRVRRKSQS